MNKKRFFSFSGIVFVLFFIGILFLLNMSMRKTNEDIQQEFAQLKIPIKIDSVQSKSIFSRYVQIGNLHSDTYILYIHGAPGSLDAYFPYLEETDLNQKFAQFSMDRLGYGFSNYGIPTLTIREQSKPFLALMNEFPTKKWIVVGHSYGGAIAAYIASEVPEIIDTLVLLGAAVDPAQEKFTFWANIGTSKLVKSLISKDLWVSSEEKMSHPKQLKEIDFIWQNLRVPTIVFHGKEDGIVPYENALYLQARIPKKHLVLHSLENEGHLFVFTNPEILKKALLK